MLVFRKISVGAIRVGIARVAALLVCTTSINTVQAVTSINVSRRTCMAQIGIGPGAREAAKFAASTLYKTGAAETSSEPAVVNRP